jgi:gamma-glutamylcyclotransferase (GGCT)/AIG2-like uncharacterized protein YtfP
MPLYFAYGSNMDMAALQSRCPQAKALGRARLAGHRFFIMAEGFASVAPDRSTDAHGVLYDVSFGDLSSLDRYEEIGRGLYTKISQPVLRHGKAPVRALVYIGRIRAAGRPKPGYMEGVLAAAKRWDLPATYIAHLTGFCEGHAGLAAEETPIGGRAIKNGRALI